MLVIDASDLRVKIDMNIYGYFSEHPGRCIYEGYWEGDNSKVLKTNGIRNDVVEALRKIKVRILRGGKVLDANIEGPGLSKQVIPLDMLFH